MRYLSHAEAGRATSVFRRGIESHLTMVREMIADRGVKSSILSEFDGLGHDAIARLERIEEFIAEHLPVNPNDSKDD